jgi:hypothetical protein
VTIILQSMPRMMSFRGRCCKLQILVYCVSQTVMQTPHYALDLMLTREGLVNRSSASERCVRSWEPWVLRLRVTETPS